MNLVRGTVRRNGDGVVVDGGNGLSLPVPAETPATEGQAVVYGVRPEHLAIGGDGAGIVARVKHVEPTGVDTYVFADAGETQLCMLSRDRRELAAGDRLRLQPRLSAVRLFDAASGRVLG
jgi:multiple sugar transport system ATP-binding protein